MPKQKNFHQLFFLVIIPVLIIGFLGGLAGGFYGAQIYKPNNANITQTYQVQEESETIGAVKKVSPSVVSVIISKDASSLTGPLDNFFNFPFEFGQPVTPAPQGKQVVGGGTGFIISADGLILTNKHVMSDATASYSVVLSDGKNYDAKIMGTDLTNDIGVLKIDAKDLPVVELGDSDKIQIGQTVIAIGYALGEYNNSVTKGIISGLNRNIVAGDNTGSSEVLEGVIQTDAAINPGNSGGPLINLAGQVIGINSAINQQGQLIGFAIPINTAKSVIDSVLKNGRIVRPYLGVRYVPITDSLSKKNNLTVNYGALIIRGSNADELAITPGSPADKAGLVENDIILEVNGVKLDAQTNLGKEVAKFKPGDELNLKILHKGEEKTVKVKLEEYKQS